MSMVRARHRRCVVLRGTPTDTADAARTLLRDISETERLWVGGEAPEAVAPREVKHLLGQSTSAVILDLHQGLDADVLGQSHGLIRGGGALVLCMPPHGEAPAGGRAALAVHPYGPDDVTHRFWDRFERCLARAGVDAPPSEALAPPPDDAQGTEEQAALAHRVAAILIECSGTLVSVVADRGRGKSSALGLALRAAQTERPLRVAVTATSEEAAAEIFRFADAGPVYLSPAELLASDARWDAIVVDEAAQLPVPLLRRLVARHPDATIAFATTARGYEGTGRGFVLRFLAELRASERPLVELRLEEPIRWSDGDPVERFVWDALALDATPADVEALAPEALVEDALEHVVLDRDALARDEARLRAFFGILVHAHYRTTPSDLHRMLDAPNIRLHALLSSDEVVAASLVALEGGLPLRIAEALNRGSRRIRGHALAETLASHSGEVEAATMTFVRSVRIATHPALRRRGLASALVDHVHESHAPDFFGTMFGATPELLAFRRSVGYALVRVGASRGARTGEPSAVMLRPVTARASAVVERLRGVLSRDLPLFLSLSEADNHLPPSEALSRALFEGLPAPAPLSEAERMRIVRSYAHGPRTYETAATALEAFVASAPSALDALPEQERQLALARIVERRGWREVAARAGYPSIPAAMRALRRAVGTLLES